MAASPHPFRRPLGLLCRHLPRVLPGVALVALFCTCKLLIAAEIASAIDLLRGAAGSAAERAPASAALLGHATWILAYILVEAVARMFSRKLIIDSSRDIEARLKRDAMAHVARLPLSWYQRSETGDLLSRLTQDVELVRFVLGPAVLYGSQCLVMLPVGGYLMYRLSPSVFLAVLAAFGALLIAMLVLMPRLQKYSKRVQEDIGAISQLAQESFMGIRVLLQFAKTQVFSARMDRLSARYVTDNMAMTRFRAVVHLFIHGCTDLVLLSVLVLGAMEVMAGNMSEGDMFLFLEVMGLLIWPLIAAGWILGLYHRARSAAERIEELFAVEPEAAPGSAPRVTLAGALEVRDLSFAYPGGGQPVLQDVSFRLPAGHKLGLCGSIGSGKSTLLHLLLRLYEPPRGCIFVDGHDICDLDLRDLRQAFALAPQEPFLFSDSVADNVRFGVAEEEIGDQRLRLAVEYAGLDQDLDSLADGLDTVVGERGVSLSGGQKQRVALARALVSGRPAVILDDTLSAVDHRTERRILDQLGGATGERSVLVASHRLSALRDADLILVLEAGRVVERGDHASLLQADGAYARAWRLQQEAAALGGDR